MARRPKVEIVYTGKAAKINEKVLRLEEELKAAKLELKAAYKEQIKAEKAAVKKAQKEAAMAAKKAMREQKTQIWQAILESGKTPEEIMEALKK